MRNVGLGGAAVAVPGAAVAGQLSERPLPRNFREVVAGTREAADLAARVDQYMVRPAPVDVAMLDWSKARSGDVKDAVDRPFTYYVPVAASGTGANQSVWKTSLDGRNASPDLEADIQLSLTPRGRPSAPGDPISDPQYVAARTRIEWDDPVLNLFGASGTAWLTIKSSTPLTFDDSYTYNEAADGTKQGQGLPVFDAATVMTDQRLAHAGDLLHFELEGLPFGMDDGPVRENAVFWAPPESGDILVDYLLKDEQGSEETRGTWRVHGGEYIQINDLHHTLGLEVRPGSGLELRVRSEDGESEVALFAALSHIDNRDPLKQDPHSNYGTLDPAILDARVYVNSGEVNDPAVYHLAARVASDVTLEGVGGDWNGDGNNDNAYDASGTEFRLDHIGQHNITTGTFTPTMSVIFSRPGFGQIGRRFTGEPYTVTPEENEHVVQMTQEVKDRINDPAVMDAITNILVEGYVPDPTDPSKAYLTTKSEWAQILSDRTDGNPDNHEITAIQMPRTPRSVILVNYWNTGASVQVNGFCKQTQRQLYSLLTGGQTW